jgi:hypothetical protein
MLLFQIYLPALQLLSNTEPRSVLLSLKGAASSKAALHVSVAWLNSTRQQQYHRQSSTGGSTSAAAFADATPTTTRQQAHLCCLGRPDRRFAAAAAAAHQHSGLESPSHGTMRWGMCLQRACVSSPGALLACLLQHGTI